MYASVCVCVTIQVDKGSQRGDIGVWDPETRQQLLALGSKQMPSLAHALGFRQELNHGTLAVGLHGKMSAPECAHLGMGACVRVCACVCACVRVCVCACVRLCVGGVLHPYLCPFQISLHSRRHP